MGFSPERNCSISYVKIWVHSVWCTKNRSPILTKEIRNNLFEHIKKNATDKKIYIDFINGYTEHVHCLMGLNSDISISKAMQLLKGESAHWINDLKLIHPKLEWADEYFAVSVSESLLDKVRNYISTQEEHHKLIPFKEEFDRFMKKYNFNNHG